MTTTAAHYAAPGPAMKVFNRVVADLARLGVSILGTRELSVRGRKSGEWRSTVVNLMTFEGERYLVAARGQTQWVRNLRAADGGRLRLGRRVEEFTAVELADEEKPELLRAYLKRWKFEVGVFFDGVGPDSSDEDLARIAHRHPVFLLRVK